MAFRQLLSVLLTLALGLSMISIGLSVPLAGVRAACRDVGVFVRAVLIGYAFVPAVAVTILAITHAEQFVAAGFLILAVCPGSPFGPAFTSKARGDVAVAAGLMTLLAASSALVSPLLVRVLLPLLLGLGTPPFPVARILLTLFVAQLAPFALGLAFRELRPRLAVRLEKWAAGANTLISVLLIVLILAADHPTLARVRLLGWVCLVTLSGVSILAGWLLAGPRSELRVTLAETSVLRNASLAMVLASEALAGTDALPAVVIYAIVSNVVGVCFALAVGRATRGRATRTVQHAAS